MLRRPRHTAARPLLRPLLAREAPGRGRATQHSYGGAAVPLVLPAMLRRQWHCLLSRAHLGATSPALWRQRGRGAAPDTPVGGRCAAGVGEMSDIAGPKRVRAYSSRTSRKRAPTQTVYQPRSVFVASLGQIADPVVPPSGVALFNPSALWVRVRSMLRSVYSMWQIRKHLKKEKLIPKLNSGLFLGPWYAEAAKQYKKFCEARANANRQSLRDLTTDEFFDVIKKNIVTPVNQLKREWDIKDLRAKVLSLRMVAIQEPDAKFVQILCRFTSQQTFKLTDTKGALVAGSASPVPMTEYYVLERPLNDAHLFRWKFLGKLDADHKEPLSKPLIEP